MLTQLHELRFSLLRHANTIAYFNDGQWIQFNPIELNSMEIIHTWNKWFEWTLNGSFFIRTNVSDWNTCVGVSIVVDHWHLYLAAKQTCLCVLFRIVYVINVAYFYWIFFSSSVFVCAGRARDLYCCCWCWCWCSIMTFL